MPIQRRIQLALGLMLASVLMLAGFLFFWLRNNYQKELSLLKNETHHLFMSSVQEVAYKAQVLCYPELVLNSAQAEPSLAGPAAWFALAR